MPAFDGRTNIGRMLRTHMAEAENHLLAQSRIPANSGHSIHKGTPREAFVKEYLVNHLSERLAIGTGEVIDAGSRPGQSRPQIDIVLYKREYPRLSFGGGIHGFLAESVVATIEVKSTLTKVEFENASRAALYLKQVKPNILRSVSSGYIPPSILSYVVAYDGPASMTTVHGWIAGTHQAIGAPTKQLSSDDTIRMGTPSPALDGVFVLGKGFLYFDNTPYGFVDSAARAANPANWVFADNPDSNLMLLFLFLTVATSNLDGSWLNPIPYAAGVQLSQVLRGP